MHVVLEYMRDGPNGTRISSRFHPGQAELDVRVSGVVHRVSVVPLVARDAHMTRKAVHFDGIVCLTECMYKLTGEGKEMNNVM